MLEKNVNESVINLRRKAAEYFQKAAWNQLLALDHYRDGHSEAAERFAQMSFEDQMYATEYAELADAELSLALDSEFEKEIETTN